ncbi:MAG: hypothetical protein K0S51_970 [Bacillales bacterium]|jgi:hypothetical protein|nr:hypothetical protein [Bacillales bacterium]
MGVFPMDQPRIFELDVTQDLANKLDPFQKIMDAVLNVKDNDYFVLIAPLKPLPLIGIMKAKGYKHKMEQLDKKKYKVTFTKREDFM